MPLAVSVPNVRSPRCSVKSHSCPRDRSIASASGSECECDRRGRGGRARPPARRPPNPTARIVVETFTAHSRRRGREKAHFAHARFRQEARNCGIARGKCRGSRGPHDHIQEHTRNGETPITVTTFHNKMIQNLMFISCFLLSTCTQVSRTGTAQYLERRKQLLLAGNTSPNLLSRKICTRGFPRI